MRKFFIPVFTLIAFAFFLSCKKQVQLASVPPFIERHTIFASGKINGQPFGIQVPGADFSTGGVDSSFHIGDSRLVGMMLYVRDFYDSLSSFYNPRNKSSFALITAPYSFTDRSDLFARIFSIGKKELGALGQQFYLYLKFNGKEYTTNGNQDGVYIKVEKVEEHRDIKKTWVWFTANCNVYDVATGTKAKLTDGEIICEFGCY